MASSMKNVPLDKLKILSLNGVQMRTFHITWLSFFVCFFGWFGLAPLMPAIGEDLGLTKSEVGNTIIAAVSATIIARLIIGRLCDTWGPRKTYTSLLLVCAVPVMLVGMAKDYASFLLFRLAIGVIGASFVITQFHTSMMFAPNVKGTANAVAGGWGNLGGGITLMVMPLIFSVIVGMGFTKGEAWRYAMLVPGIMMLVMAFLYYRFTKDTPAGNYDETKREAHATKKNDWTVLADWRVWSLSLAYAVCFGMEITFDGIAADRAGKKFGMRGKGLLLGSVLLLEGVGLMFFAKAGALDMAIISMLSFALFLKMANGATYAIVPFVNSKNVGMVSGIVGAGGNVGGMLFRFLFKSSAISYAQAFLYIGLTVLAVSSIVFLTKFGNQKKVVSLLENESVEEAAVA